LVEGRSGAVRLLGARFAFTFADFFWDDLATVLLVSISRLSLGKTPNRKRCARLG
jgi:hypothetical protein